METKAAAFQSVSYMTVSDDFEGQRLDNFLFRELKGAPRSLICRIVRRGEVRVNAARVAINYRLQQGDKIRIPPVRLSRPDGVKKQPGKQSGIISNAIIYEDERLLVVNKPSGMAVHGGSGLSYGVIELLRSLRPHSQNLELVHRLDRDTSGCLLISKKRSALRQMHELMRENKIDKHYQALVAGYWPERQKIIDAPLRKNTLRGGERLVRVDAAGKAARTGFRVLKHFSWQATLLEVELFSGRTHQIRVHTQYAGHAIAGDRKYGDENFNQQMKKAGLKRLFLHASSLSFQWPQSKEFFRIKAPLPKDLQQLQRSL
ncbi:MAG: 23S rRNA pseudouridine(955/2504/2580) synthase RluC [gamma proteobacterium symbiont of Bathyaustriella thionipta]|nr:23S rRNA pseudouridine(955/2504/2580) synthase RluC [gamma proteobacterium symbiont of Bathyaustriella thionipta]